MPMPFRRRNPMGPMVQATLQHGPLTLDPNANGRMVPRGLGPADFKPSQPRGGNPQRRIILPGCDFPPADAIPVDKVNEADIGNGGTATMFSFQVPDTLTFRIDGIGFSADDEAALRFISWDLFVTPPKAPITPYLNMPAGIGSITEPSWVFVVVGSSVLVELIVNNTAPVPVTYHYASRVKGWLYAEKEPVA